jgi:MFS family permease
MSALRDARFRRLLIGQSLSSFGDSALYLSLAIWAKDLTGSNAAAGAVFLALGAASLLAPVGGYLVDRATQRRRLMMITDAATAVVVLALLLVHTRQQLWLLYAVAFAYGLSANVIGPATTALVKDMLAEDDLGSFNALRQTLRQGLRLLSPIVGAALYASAGGGSLAVFDAMTFGASIAAVASLRVVESAPPAIAGVPFRAQLEAGFAHLFGQPVLRRLSLVSAAAMLAIGFYESIDFAVVAALGEPPSFFGTLMSIQAAGSIVGGLVVSRMMRRLGESRAVGIGLGCFALASAALTATWMWVVVAAVVVLGAGITFFVVGLYTALQRRTPPRLQGRVGAASYVLTDIPQTLSIGVGAALITAVSYRLLLAVLVLATVCSAIALLARGDTERDPRSVCGDQSSARPAFQRRYDSGRQTAHGR